MKNQLECMIHILKNMVKINNMIFFIDVLKLNIDIIFKNNYLNLFKLFFF